MKRERKQYIAILVSLVFIVLIFIIQSCDLASQEEVFENPYTEKTEQTFSEISESVFDNVAKNVENKAYGTVTGDDIMRYANEGYRQWAQKNGTEPGAFMAGAKATQRLQNFQLKSGKSGTSSQTTEAFLDSVFTELGLTKKQIKFILEIPKIVEKSGNIAKLERRLNKFDEKVYKQLGEEDSEAVLRMSALMQATMGFITHRSKLLATLAELVEENKKQQSYFYQPNMMQYSENIFQLTQGGVIDPPNWNDYFSMEDAFAAGLFGAAAGGIVFGEAGAKVGLLGGPWGPFIGGTVGGLFGIIGGGAGGAGYYYRAKVNQFDAAVVEWCNDSVNGNHPDHGAICGD